MKLWTYQPAAFRVDAGDLIIDPTKGQYWRNQEANFRYRDVLPKLQELVGTDQFIWSYMVHGQCIRVSEDHDLIEWELNVPVSQILRFVKASVWETIVWTQTDDWASLFVVNKPEPSEDIHALVLMPLPSGYARSHGPLRPQHTKEQLNYAREAAARSRALPAHERALYDW